ncbi:MAG: sugar ABC transporter permease [Meiothermus sp.]|nr:sugar ABC transporter permease [Meiothermus sp.]
MNPSPKPSSLSSPKPAAHPMSKHTAQDNLRWFAVLVLPGLLLLAVFTYWPILFTFGVSFTDWNMIRPEKHLVGLKNYQELLTSPVFYQVLGNTLVFAFFTVFIRLGLSLLLAVLLFQNIRFKTFFRTIIFLPFVTSTAVAAIVWLFVLDPYFGVFKVFFDLLGQKSPVWVSDPNWAMPAIIMVAIWKSVGFSTVIYLAALSNINPELQEAARIDGASEWQVFRRITLPLLGPVTLFLVITGIIHTMQSFEIPSIMTQGGPLSATNIYVLHLYELAFQRFRAGYASALACVFFVIILALTLINLHLSKRWVHY